MNNPACSAEHLESNRSGAKTAIVFCVFHLIAGVAVALAAFGALALFAA